MPESRLKKLVFTRCNNIAGFWIDRLANCEQQARVFFPYITKLAEQALRTKNPRNVQIYTCFDLMAFASGASCLMTLRKLSEAEYQLFHLDRLHAKVFEHPESGFATVGSQNLTYGGTKNREATVIIRDPILLQKLKSQLDRWAVKRMPLTLSMIVEAEAAVADYRRTIRSLSKICRKAQKEILMRQFGNRKVKSEKSTQGHSTDDGSPRTVASPSSGHTNTDISSVTVNRRDGTSIQLHLPATVKQVAEAFLLKPFQLNKILIEMNIFPSPNQVLESETIQEISRHLEESWSNTNDQHVTPSVTPIVETPQKSTEELILSYYQRRRKECLARLGDIDVPKEVCYQVASKAQNVKIRGPSSPCPGDAKHLMKGPYGWEINLGGRQANRFGVELAIKWCRARLAEFFPEHTPRFHLLTEDERETLAWLIRCAVLGFKNKPYNDTYPIEPDGSLNVNGTHYLMPQRTADAVVHYAGFDRSLF